MAIFLWVRKVNLSKNPKDNPRSLFTYVIIVLTRKSVCTSNKLELEKTFIEGRQEGKIKDYFG